ncbi:Lrp/AsnC family transcriptional regulator [Mucilaginibacter corticis]|uniref:Lrp/AsnC family transcriptional regulator n=1 Tax=Mucilaginibacter corticis TaxID=2597670 RepID=A0A556M9R4_9SPHI|nr:Lrp/AsnC family transcriptional regulator [Mucilaginibacter corticis]TSJ36596.1 Lrp/AsnC family transcriptional regulator [Mucilaginibacter corticis]
MKELDKTDQGILKLLEQDCTLTHKEIAFRLHKSVNAIHTRIRSLENTGYIKRYRAEVDHKKVGKGLICYVQVQLKQHSKESLAAYRSEVVKVAEVMECYHLTGSFDFLLRVACRDIDEYDHILNEILSALPDVGNMQSLFVMSEVKHETGYMF